MSQKRLTSRANRNGARPTCVRPLVRLQVRALRVDLLAALEVALVGLLPSERVRVVRRGWGGPAGGPRPRRGRRRRRRRGGRRDPARGQTKD